MNLYEFMMGYGMPYEYQSIYPIIDYRYGIPSIYGFPLNSMTLGLNILDYE